MKTSVAWLALVLSANASATCFYTEEGRLIDCDDRPVASTADREANTKDNGSPSKQNGRGFSSQTSNPAVSDDDSNDIPGNGGRIIIYQAPQGSGADGDSDEGNGGNGSQE